jgi:hypothetical protein
MAWRLPRVQRPTSSRAACLFLVQVSKNELGDYVPPDKQHPQQEDNLYTTLSDAYTKVADAELSLCHVYRRFNMIEHIRCIISDLLRTILIGKLDHLQKWIFHLMKTHEQLDKYNAIWLFVPAYHHLTQNNK